MNKQSTIILLLVICWMAVSLFLMFWGFSFSEISSHLAELATRVKDGASDLIPSRIWGGGLTIALFIAALPGIIGILIDGKGQSASGWLFLFGVGASLLALTIVVLGYILITIISFIAGVFF